MEDVFLSKMCKISKKVEKSIALNYQKCLQKSAYIVVYK